MKDKIKPLDEAYKECFDDGLFRPKNFLDKDLIISLTERAEEGLLRLKAYGEAFEKKTHTYSFLFRDNYEVLRMLIDAYLLFDKVQISNHQCSNAYLCTKHSDLEFDWKILETMRLIRNRVNYKGEKVSKEQWDSVKIQFKIYIQSLQKLIKEKNS